MTQMAKSEADSRIRIKRIIHTIHATEDLALCRSRYLDALGGLIFAEGYFEAEDRDMALLYVADHMIEPMAPRDPKRQDKPFARYVQRYGEGFHSFEIKIEDGPATAARLKAAGCKLAAEYGSFFYVRQESTGGVLLEVCELPMPNDPYDRPGFDFRLAGRHKSTLLSLDHIACVIPNAEAARAFFGGVLDGEVLSDERISAPQPARRTLMQLADTRVAFIQPDERSSGPLGTFLDPPSSGIYALVWRVEDEAKAEDFFREKGLRTTREACVSQGFAIDPRDFLGARHEFVGRSA
jgi:catechol 2,3-dioxygenase-like lactoylglutathione lyase family enzyme